jgi:hypothetical protein
VRPEGLGQKSYNNIKYVTFPVVLIAYLESQYQKIPYFVAGYNFGTQNYFPSVPHIHKILEALGVQAHSHDASEV